MTVHATSFPIDQKVGPAPAAEALLPAAAPVAQLVAAKKVQSSQAVIHWCGDRRAGGRAWYGFDYWTVGRFLVSTDDAYVKGRQHHHRPKVTGYLAQVS
jgi:Multidrug resistance efflux pump